MHPERVSATALFASFARFLVADDYPMGMSPEALDIQVAAVRELWGTEDLVRLVLPESGREQLRRFRGREINTTGDGFMATFDGPARGHPMRPGNR
jgi:hypothetical protein